MKRFLILAVTCLFAAVSCDFDYDLSIDASADVFFQDMTSLKTGVVVFDSGFHSRHLSDYQLSRIWDALSRNVNMDNFSSAMIHLDVYNKIGNEHLGMADYSVLYDQAKREYVFTDMNVTY